MRTILALLATLALAIPALAQVGSPLPSTAYTRGLLRSTDAAAARTALELVTTNVSIGMTNVFTTNSPAGATNAVKSMALETISTNAIQVANIRAFGAVGDNTADDTAAISNAVNYAAFSNAGPTRVFVPAGIYKVSKQIAIPSNAQTTDRSYGTNLVGIFGEGGIRSVIRTTATNGSLLEWNIGAGSTSLRNFTIQDIGFAGPGLTNIDAAFSVPSYLAMTNTYSTFGLAFIGADDKVSYKVAVRGVQVYGFKIGVVVSNSVNFVLQDSIVQYNWHSQVAGYRMDTTLIDSCNFGGTPVPIGVTNDAVAAIVINGARSVTVRNCEIDGKQAMIGTGVKGFNIAGGNIEAIYGPHCFTFSQSHGVFSGIGILYALTDDHSIFYLDNNTAASTMVQGISPEITAAGHTWWVFENSEANADYFPAFSATANSIAGFTTNNAKAGATTLTIRSVDERKPRFLSTGVANAFTVDADGRNENIPGFLMRKAGVDKVAVALPNTADQYFMGAAANDLVIRHEGNGSVWLGPMTGGPTMRVASGYTKLWGGLSFANMQTNTAGGASPVLWMRITNNGTAYLLPAYAIQTP